MHCLKYLFFFIIVLAGCNVPSLDDVTLEGEYAVPLINSKISLADLLGNDEDVNIIALPDGTLSLQYHEELLSDSISDLLPSIPSIGEVEIFDTVSFLPIVNNSQFILTKALLSGDEMRFRYSHDKDEDVSIKMKIPELSKDGKIFEFDYVLESTGTLPFTSFTPSVDLSGYEFNSEENKLTFIYDARNPKGERIVLTFAAMSFNLLTFEFGEGNAKRTVYSLKGDSIAINLFDRWKSGMLEFEKPYITFEINHSYGFPIALRINEVQFNTLDGNSKYLIADAVSNEIPLNYPSTDEIGITYKTDIPFDNSNSNIKSLFSEQIGVVAYDIDAIINPENDESLKGFVTDESAFKLNVDLFLPFIQKITDLRIHDTFDIENIIPDDFSEGELKIITQNLYPVNMEVNLIFLDENNQEMERLLDDNPLIIEPNVLKTRFVNLEPSKISVLKKAKRIVVEPVFDSSQISEDYVQFSSDHFFELRVGLKFKL